MSELKVHLYALVWNERPLLPYFLEHYRPFVDRFFLFDDGSDDGSVEYLDAQPDVELRTFGNEGDSFVESARIFYCEAWKASRGEADFVVVVNIDELVYHPNPREALEDARSRGWTAFPSRGWDMVSDAFPTSGPLVRTTNRGVHSRGMNKIAIFDPNAITEMQYSGGRHRAVPRGKVLMPRKPLFDLMHYKHLGLDYVMARYRAIAVRLRAGDISAKFGKRYFKPDHELRAEHERLMSAARPVLLPDMVAESLVDRPLDGVFVAQCRAVTNDKGGLQEIWRDDDPFVADVRQVYTTVTGPGVIKAWYRHETQVDQVITLSGSGRLILWDTRAGPPGLAPVTIRLDAAAPRLIIVPPGIWHGFKADDAMPLVLLHLNDMPFDHLATDEMRVDISEPGTPACWDE